MKTQNFTIFIFCCLSIAIPASSIKVELQQAQRALLSYNNEVLFSNEKYVVYTHERRNTIMRFDRETNQTISVKTPSDSCPDIYPAFLKGVDGHIYCIDWQKGTTIVNEIDILGNFETNHTFSIDNSEPVMYSSLDNNPVNYLSAGHLLLNDQNTTYKVFDIIEQKVVCELPFESLPKGKLTQATFNSNGIYLYSDANNELITYYYSCQEKKIHQITSNGVDALGIYSYYNANKLMIVYNEFYDDKQIGFYIYEFSNGKLNQNSDGAETYVDYTKLNDTIFCKTYLFDGSSEFLIQSLDKDSLLWTEIANFVVNKADEGILAYYLEENQVMLNFEARYANYDLKTNSLTSIENSDASLTFKNGSLITAYHFGYAVKNPGSQSTQVVHYGQYDEYWHYIKGSAPGQNNLYGINVYGGDTVQIVEFDGNENKVTKFEIKAADNAVDNQIIVEDVQKNSNGKLNVLYRSFFKNINILFNNSDKIQKIQDDNIASFRKQKVFTNYESDLIYVVNQADIQAKLVTYSLKNSSIVNSVNIGPSFGTLIQKIDNEILMTVTINIKQQQYQIKFYDVRTSQVIQQYQLGHILDVSTTQVPIPVDYKKTSDGKFNVKGFIVQHTQGGVSLFNTKGDFVKLYDLEISGIFIDGPSTISLIANNYLGTGAKLTYKFDFEEDEMVQEEDVRIKLESFLQKY